MEASEDPRVVAVGWLSSFASALSSGDAEAVATLFLPDGWLRDILTFTWDNRSLEGRKKIIAYLSDTLPAKPISEVKLLEEQHFQPVFVPVGSRQVIEFGYAFETPIAYGQGFVRLLQDEQEEWKSLIVSTVIMDLKGHEEMPGRYNFEDSLQDICWGLSESTRKAQIESNPHVIIIGGGQTGLNVAARFKQMNISTLIIERTKRVGDSWRQRYLSLALHTVREQHEMLYQPHPSNWPIFTPRDKVVSMLEAYAVSQDLIIWTSSTPKGQPTYDAEERQWTITIDHDGVEVVLHPAHIVLATGAGNSSIDICEDLVKGGAKSVTMVQRSSTCVASRKNVNKHITELWAPGIPTEVADFKNASIPNGLIKKTMISMQAEAWEEEKELHDKLRKGGLKLNLGPDGAGLQLLITERYGGYWLDKGGADLIESGDIKIKQGTQPTSFTSTGLLFADGSELPADAVIWATGYINTRELNKKVFGADVIEKTSEVWGLDEEGELKGSYRPSGHPGLWYATGAFFNSRFQSKQLLPSSMSSKKSLAVLSFSGDRFFEGASNDDLIYPQALRCRTSMSNAEAVLRGGRTGSSPELLRALHSQCSIVRADCSLVVQRSTINRLPVELLIIIFLVVAGTSDHDDAWLNVLRLAHVCSLWRGILLAYGEPWSTLPSWDFMSANGEITNFLIERSRRAPLRIEYGAKIPNEWQKSFIQAYMSRFRNFGTTLLSDSMDQVQQHATRGRTQVFPYLFLSRAMRLDSLQLTGCRLAYTPANYQNLVSLDLNLISLRRGVDYEDSILTAIINSPNLRDLAIRAHYDLCLLCDDWNPSLDDMPAPQSRRYALQHLSRLELNLPLPYMLLILGAVTLPDPHTIDSIVLSVCSLSPTSKRHFKITDVLSPQYIPANLLENTYDWTVRNYWYSDDPNEFTEGFVPELCLSMDCRGVAVCSNDQHHYEISVRFHNLDDSMHFVDKLSGVCLSMVNQLEYHTGSNTTDALATNMPNRVKLSSLLELTPSILSLDLWVDNCEAAFNSGDSYSPFYVRGGTASLNPELCKNLEELRVRFTHCWNLTAFQEIAALCKSLPCLRRLAVSSQCYACFKEEDDHKEVAQAVKQLGLPYESVDSKLQLGICVTEPRTWYPGEVTPRSRDGNAVAATVDLNLLLHNDEDYNRPGLAGCFANVYWFDPCTVFYHQNQYVEYVPLPIFDELANFSFHDRGMSSDGVQITIPDFDDDNDFTSTPLFGRPAGSLWGAAASGQTSPVVSTPVLDRGDRNYFHSRGDSVASEDSSHSIQFAARKFKAPFVHTSHSSLATSSSSPFSKKTSFASLRNAFKKSSDSVPPPVPILDHQAYPVLKNPFNRSTSSLAQHSHGRPSIHASPTQFRPSTPASGDSKPRGQSRSRGHASAKSQHSHSGSIFHTSDAGSDLGHGAIYVPSLSPPPVPPVPEYFPGHGFGDEEQDDDNVVVEARTPADFALHAIFIRFAASAEALILDFVEQPDDREPQLLSYMGPGVDPTFDALLQSLGKIAQKHAKPVVESVMRWRKGQTEAGSHDLHPLYSGSSKSRVLPSSSYDAEALLTERRSLASIYIMCRALAVITQSLSRDSLSDAAGNELEATIFERLRDPDVKLLTSSSNHRLNSELYAVLLGNLANIRFESVTDRYLTELAPVAAGQVPKDSDFKYEHLVRCIRHVWPPESFEEGAEFLESLSKSFENAHGFRLKSVFADTLTHLLYGIANTAQAEVNHPQWAKAIEVIHPKVRDMANKPRYWHVAFPLAVVSLCVAPREYFLRNWMSLIEGAISKLKVNLDKPFRIPVLNSILRLLWTYLYRCHESASTAATKVETLLRHFFPSNRLAVFPQEDRIELFAYMVHFVLSRHFDIGSELCLELLQERNINSQSNNVMNHLAQDRMSIAVQAILLSIHLLEKEDQGVPVPVWPSPMDFSAVPSEKQAGPISSNAATSASRPSPWRATRVLAGCPYSTTSGPRRV
ncbi:hypothetical protein NM688_g2858 [Phlebia brevispora]|uniref:Uncharacterized protein n=1 Tax=Phlebia brevispora TaxID=194682 RepID=A0ACC1T7M8_9APHY|nr:hypothetical protein NM688_g2858 [Phlebia brevispora]